MDTESRELRTEPIASDDNVLEQLLASVRRIDSGLEGIRTLVIEGRPRAAGATAEHPTRSEQTLVSALERHLEGARREYAHTARVPCELLREAIWLLKDMTGAR